MSSQLPTNRLLVAASACYAAAGLPLLFAADQVMAQFDGGASAVAHWIAGLLGGALTAFALLNWVQRHTLMGGIYGRPLLIANLLLLSNITFSSLRMWRADHLALYAVTGVIGAMLFAAFGRLFFRNPAALRDTTRAPDA